MGGFTSREAHTTGHTRVNDDHVSTDHREGGGDCGAAVGK